MPSSELDRAAIARVIDAITDRLDGEWLLIGGALVALWAEPRRVTEDIDVVGMRGTPDERYALMNLAIELGLPIEVVNSAADFFVRRIPGWRDEVEVLQAGARSTVYRPTPTLFVILKLGRLSEQDLADCEAVLRQAPEGGVKLDRCRAALAALPTTEDAALVTRRAALDALLR
jgi:hypothetical protein